MTFTDWKIGETYKRRDGHTLRMVAIAPDGQLIVDGPHIGYLSYRYPDGRFYDNAEISPFDMVPPPRERRTVWLNIYPSNCASHTGHPTAKTAEYWKMEGRIGNAVRVDLERGDDGNFYSVKPPGRP